jgi:predicted transcriptional regulator
LEIRLWTRGKVCDYFAACLLMPRRWLRQAWSEGMRDVPGLARRFGVTPKLSGSGSYRSD